MDNIFDPEGYNNLTPLQVAYKNLEAIRQYQQDWIEHGVDSVHLYFEDVEGNWLDEWKPITFDHK